MNKSWMILCAATLATMAFADGDNGDVKVSGNADVYYQWNLHNVGGDLSLRPSDAKTKTVTLNTARVSLRPKTEKKLMWTVDLTLGKSPDALNALEPGGRDKYKIIEQAFVTYGLSKGSLDFGKFVSPVGIEVADTTQNLNYTRGMNSTYGVPAYHAGLRYNTSLSDMPAQIYLATGWNEVESSNNNMSLGLHVEKKVAGGWDVAGNYYTGHEGRRTPAKHNSNSLGGVGFTTAGIRDVHLFDVTAKYKANANTDVALEYLSGNAYHVGPATNLKWSGFAGYVGYKAGAKTTVGLRTEIFRDIDGAFSGQSQDLASTTLTFKHEVTSGQTAIIEWRGDRSNKAIFATGGPAKKYRDSLLLGYQVKF